jgi:hypothetical protein
MLHKPVDQDEKMKGHSEGQYPFKWMAAKLTEASQGGFFSQRPQPKWQHCATVGPATWKSRRVEWNAHVEFKIRAIYIQLWGKS